MHRELHVLAFIVSPVAPAVRDHGYEQSNSHAVAMHYIRGWFAVDLFSSVPFDRLARLAQNDPLRGVPSLRVSIISPADVLKLLRIMRIGRYVNDDMLPTNLHTHYSRL